VTDSLKTLIKRLLVKKLVETAIFRFVDGGTGVMPGRSPLATTASLILCHVVISPHKSNCPVFNNTNVQALRASIPAARSRSANPGFSVPGLKITRRG